MATFDFTPVSGGDNVVGTLESVVQLKAFIITVKNADDAAVDLRAQDGVHGSAYDLLLREVQPVMAFAPDNATGVVHVIVDGHAVDAATLQLRLRALVAGSGLGGTAATNDTTVVEGTAFTVVA